MGNHIARYNKKALGRLSTLGFAVAFIVTASVVTAFIQPTGVARALDEGGAPVVDPAPTALVFTNTPAEKTNLTSLTWQWQLSIAEGDTTQYTGYTYSLKTADGIVVDQGAGDATLVTYTKSDAQSGQTYTLTVVATTDPTTPPEGALSATSTVEVNTVPPVIKDNGTTWSGNTATPGLEVTSGQQPATPPVPTDPTTPTTTDPEAPTDTPAEMPTEGETPPETPPAPVYTYNWTTTADAYLVGIDDTTLLNPTITFYADGRATFTIRVTDAFGNFVDYILNLSYVKPFIPGPNVPLLPDYTPPALPPIVTATKIPPLSNRVAIDSAPAVSSNDGAGEVKGESTTDAPGKKTPIIAATPTHGWVLFGISWYWWVLVIGIIGSAILWYRSYRQHSADDM